jgi:hypothetical protein
VQRAHECVPESPPVRKLVAAVSTPRCDHRPPATHTPAPFSRTPGAQGSNPSRFQPEPRGEPRVLARGQRPAIARRAR